MIRFTTLGAGPFAHAGTAGIGIGGAESNVAVGLTRLGTRAIWVGRVGADPLGDLVANTLRGEGVDVRVTRDEAPTGLMVKELRTASTTRVWYYRAGSAGSRIQPDDLQGVSFSPADLLHVTGIAPALSESARATITVAIDLARAAGGRVSFDINHRPRLWGDRDAITVLEPMLATADIVIGGTEELRLFAPHLTGRDLASDIAARGPGQVVVKMGAHGAAALDGGVYLEQAAAPAVVRDTVGAGDAFVAGYLSEVMAGSSLAHRLRVATRVAAMVCEVEGDWEGLPTRDELARFDAAERTER